MTEQQIKKWLATWPSVQEHVMRMLADRETPYNRLVEVNGWLAAMSVQVERVKRVVETED